jgi:hypothetical protein
MENLTGQTGIVLPSHNPQFDGPRGLAILTVFIFRSKFNLDLPHGNVLQYARYGSSHILKVEIGNCSSGCAA